MAGSLLQSLKQVRPHVRAIAFPRRRDESGSALIKLSRDKFSTQSAPVTAAPAKSESTAPSFLDLPSKYARKAPTPLELEIIELGGAKP